MEQLSSLSIEALKARKSRIKGILIGFMVLAGMLVAVYAYMYFVRSKPMSASTFVPLMVLPITWLPILNSLRAISAEIDLRKNNYTAKDNIV